MARNKKQARRRRGAEALSIHQHLQLFRDEGGFRPMRQAERIEANAGSREKVEALRQRAERGEELWCEQDGTDYAVDGLGNETLRKATQ